MRKDAGLGEVAWIVIAAIAVVALVIGGYAIYTATADVRGRAAVHNQIHGDPNYRIAQYEHFFDLCAQVQTMENNIANEEQEAKTASPARKDQLTAVVTAQRNNRAELINQYNADASAAGTRGNFLASNLPYRLSVQNKETQCSA